MFARVILASLYFVLVGCETTFSGFPEKPSKTSDELALTQFAFTASEVNRYRAAAGAQKKLLRNEIIDARLRALDIKFGEFEEDLFKFGVGTGIGTDWTTLALAGLTATVGGESTKAALGAVQAGVVGAKASIDKRLFMEKTLPVIMAEMINQRKSVLVDIREGLAKDVADYNLYQGLSDLERYRRAGSLPGALNGIVKTAGKETKESEDKISAIIKGTYVKDEAGDKLRLFWKPNGTAINTTNEAALKGWMTANGLSIAPGRVAIFLRDAMYADLRVKAAKDLSL